MGAQFSGFRQPVPGAGAGMRALERWRDDNYGMADRAGGCGERARMRSDGRALSSDGTAAARWWALADGAGAAYRLELGWHWVGIVDGREHGADGAAMLSIGPDGSRAAESFRAADDAWAELGRLEDGAAEVRDDLASPAAFLAFLEPVAAPAPVRVAAPVAPAPVILEPVAAPAPVSVRVPLRWDLAPVAPDPVPVRVARRSGWRAATARAAMARAAGWLTGARRMRQLAADNLAAIIGPWSGASPAPEFGRPRLVRLDLATGTLYDSHGRPLGRST